METKSHAKYSKQFLRIDPRDIILLGNSIGHTLSPIETSISKDESEDRDSYQKYLKTSDTEEEDEEVITNIDEVSSPLNSVVEKEIALISIPEDGAASDEQLRIDAVFPNGYSEEYYQRLSKVSRA